MEREKVKKMSIEEMIASNRKSKQSGSEMTMSPRNAHPGFKRAETNIFINSLGMEGEAANAMIYGFR